MSRIVLIFRSVEMGVSLKKALEEAGHRVKLFTSTGLKTYLWLFWCDYDLIYTNSYMLPSGVFFGAFKGVPSYVQVRGIAEHKYRESRKGFLKSLVASVFTWFSFKFSTGIFFVSKHARDYFLGEFPGLEDKSWVVHNSTELDRFGDVEPIDLGEEFGIDSEYTLVSVTNLGWKHHYKAKGVEEVIEAFSLIKGDFDASLLIVGGGKWLSDLKERYSDTEGVFFAGYRRDVENILKACDLFVYSSFEDAYPSVVLEAEASGLPVVVPDRVGLSEAAGYPSIVTEPDAGDLADGVRLLLGSPSFLRGFGESCRLRMEKESWSDIVDEYLEIWSFLEVDG